MRPAARWLGAILSLAVVAFVAGCASRSTAAPCVVSKPPSCRPSCPAARRPSSGPVVITETRRTFKKDLCSCGGGGCEFERSVRVDPAPVPSGPIPLHDGPDRAWTRLPGACDACPGGCCEIPGVKPKK